MRTRGRATSPASTLTRFPPTHMLRVQVTNITSGMVLARPVTLPSDPRRYLLQRDVEISPVLIPKLEKLGIREVWIRHRDLEFLEDIIDEGLGEQQREVYAHVRRNFEAIMGGTCLELDIVHFQKSIAGLFDFLKSSSCGNMLLQKLDSFDNYLMSHSTNVCYLALLLGMKLERYLIDERSSKSAQEAKDLKQLGLGCLLHDVGKMRIPQEILNKPARLTDEEMRVMQMHPTYGYEMLRNHAPGAAAQVVLNHHQRWDGTGYPARCDARTREPLPPLANKQIPIFCRIATMVDIYDAATTKRVYSEAKPPVQVLHEMRTICHGYFDPVVERAFFQIIPPFPIGQVVKLNNHIEAVVVDFNANSPTRPKVRGLRDPGGQHFADPSLEEIDLALYPELEIAWVNDVDVRPFQTSQRTMPSPQWA